MWARRGRDDRRGAAGRAAVLALSLLPALQAARADDGPPTWAVYNAPPYMIASGPDAGRGIFDQIRVLLGSRLGDAAPSAVLATFPRGLASIEAGKPWCFVGGVKSPERDRFAVFSLPISIFYPLSIVVHRTRVERFRAMGKLSLEAMLEGRSLRTSVLQGRVLAPGIDALMRRYGPVPTHSEFDEAYRMLLNDRLDFLVDFTPIASFAARQMGQGDDFATLPFKEAPAPGFNRVMCPKTPWGRAMIERINTILRVERPTPAYRQIVESWSVAADAAQIRAIYDTSFLRAE